MDLHLLRAGALRNGFSLLVIFWSAYLLINDWRLAKPWKHSLTGKFCAAARLDLSCPSAADGAPVRRGADRGRGLRGVGAGALRGLPRL
ncbi:MAG: hypothetical protein ACLVL7_11035 [Anaerotruncus massiliensis (ex Togo et al. 2019)]